MDYNIIEMQFYVYFIRLLTDSDYNKKLVIFMAITINNNVEKIKIQGYSKRKFIPVANINKPKSVPIP